jgi:methylated-DNA-[protein]-cysteine S-methyltransferase
MDFNHRVWELCKSIPKGKVSTYKEIARALNTKAYRAVGNALNKNPYAPIVPCHRVVNSDGRVGGFARGAAAKIALLEKECVEVRSGRVDLSRHLFRF